MGGKLRTELIKSTLRFVFSPLGLEISDLVKKMRYDEEKGCISVSLYLESQNNLDGKRPLKII